MTKNTTSQATLSTYGATDNLYSLIRFYGYLMPQRYKCAYIIYAIFLIGFCTFYLPFAFTKAFCESENLTKDLGVFFTTLQVTFNIYGGSIKVTFLGLMLRKLHSTRAMVDKLDARCKDADEICEQIKIIRLGRKLVIVIVVMYLTYSTSTCIGAILNNRPPYSIYVPLINWRNSRREFWIATIFEFVLMDAACIQQALNDSYAAVYICILRGHVRILKMRIGKLGTSSNDRDNIEQLKMCIKDHKVLLDFQRTFSPVISVTVFIQFSLTAIMLGTTLINVTIFSTDFSIRLGSFIYFVAVSGQIFPVCYFAHSLQNESAELSVRIFHSHWITQNSQYRKLLIFFMQRTQYLIQFSAGKLFPITLLSFLSIIKFSFSLYTLIKKMDLKPKTGLE